MESMERKVGLWIAAFSFSIFIYASVRHAVDFALVLSFLISWSILILWAAKGFLFGFKDSLTAISMILMAALGPLGSATVVMTALLQYLSRSSLRDGEWLISLGRDLEDSEMSVLEKRLNSIHDRAEIGGEYYSSSPIVPLLDVIKYGNFYDKQRALNQIGRYYQVEYLPALKLALVDPQNLVRVQAAATMTLIEEKMSSRPKISGAAKNDLPKKRGDHLSQARNLALQVLGGLLDPVSMRRCNAQAITALRTLNEEQELVPADLLIFARVLLEGCHYVELRPLLRRLSRIQSIERADVDPLIKRLLFETGRYRVLGRFADLERSNIGFLLSSARLENGGALSGI